MNLATQVWLRERPDGTVEVFWEPTEGATEFRCHACQDATGGQCIEHQEPECTCYEVTGGHMPGCAFNRPAPIVVDAMAVACPDCGARIGDHFIRMGTGKLECPNSPVELAG